MKKLNLIRAIIKSTSIVSLLWVIALSSAVQAQITPMITYNGDSTFKDIKGTIYRVTSSPVTISYGGVEVSKSLYSDACGFARISFNSTSTSVPSSVTFNGTANSIGSLTKIVKPGYKCVNGVATWKIIPQTDVFKVVTENSNGDDNVVVYYPPARTGGAIKQNIATYSSDLTSKLKPNACGFITVSPTANSQKRTSTALSIDGSSIDLAGLAINPSPPECIKGKLYTGGASTATVSGASIYRTNKAVYVTGLTPRSLNVVNYDSLESQSFKSGYCGLVEMHFKKEVPALIKIGSSSYNTGTMTTGFYTSCGSSSFNSMAANTLYRDSERVFFYKTTDLSKKSIVVERSAMVTKNILVNPCGFSVIPSLNNVSGFSTGDKLVINGSTPYDVLTLPLATAAPICRNGVIYTSAS